MATSATTQTKNEPELESLKTRDGLTIWYRKGTSDEKAIREACANVEGEQKRTSSYERTRRAPMFKLEEGDIWLDCGTHIGSFTLRALKNGASKVISVEPEQGSHAILQRNLQVNGLQDKVIVYNNAIVTKMPRDKQVTLHITPSTYRHTIREGVKHLCTQTVGCIKLSDLLKKHKDVTGVKLDIEGNEKDIICSVDWSRTKVKKLVLEYSLDHHPVLDDFYDMIDHLKATFSTVFFRPSLPPRGAVWDTKITRGANGWLVWCIR